MYDYEKLQRKFELDRYEDCREIEKAQAKAIVKERVKIDALKYRQQLKEEEAERKKTVCEEVQILASGKLQIVTKNLRIDAQPRDFTNMQNPRLVICKRIEDDADSIYLLICTVQGRVVDTYFDANMAGNASYLLRKLFANGISFFGLSTMESKRLVMQLFCVLMADTAEKRWLADSSGWLKREDGQFIFIDEEAMTWGKAKKLAK